MGTQLYQLQQMKHSGFGKFLELRIPQRRLRLKTQEWLSATFILTSAKKYLSTLMDVQLKVVINVLFSLYKSLHALCSCVGFLCSMFYFLLFILFLPLVLIYSTFYLIPQRRLRLKTQEWISATFILTSANKYLSTLMDVQLKVVINVLFSLYKSLHALCSSVGFLCSTFYFLLCILFLPLVLIYSRFYFLLCILFLPLVLI